MSRKCRVCGKPFRPGFSTQKFCMACWRLAANTDPKEDTMTTTSTELAEREEIVEGELVPYQPRTPATLFRTDDPDVALARMSAIAKTLVDVIERQHLYANIRGKRHITLEGWTTLGGMSGVHAIVTETRVNEAGDGIVAHAEARTLTGQLVGAADGECSRAEQRWRTADPYAIRSMASTRAMSRALRAPLGQIVVLAGYEPAGADEIPAEPVTDAVVDEDAGKGKIPPERQPTAEQWARINELLGQLAEKDPSVDWPQEARRLAGCPGDQMTGTVADMVIDQLARRLDQEREEAA